MKKMIGILCVCCILASLTACGSSAETSSGNEPTTTTDAETIADTEAEATVEGQTEITTEEKTETESASDIKEETETDTDKTSLEPTQLYLDFFEPYADSVDILLVEDFLTMSEEKFNNYVVDVQEGNEEDSWRFYIDDDNGNHMSVWFFPTSESLSEYFDQPSMWVNTLATLTYSDGEKEISVTDQDHVYNEPEYHTSDKNRETPQQNVESVDELKIFMFG